MTEYKLIEVAQVLNRQIKLLENNILSSFFFNESANESSATKKIIYPICFSSSNGIGHRILTYSFIRQLLQLNKGEEEEEDIIFNYNTILSPGLYAWPELLKVVADSAEEVYLMVFETVGLFNVKLLSQMWAKLFTFSSTLANLHVYSFNNNINDINFNNFEQLLTYANQVTNNLPKMYIAINNYNSENVNTFVSPVYNIKNAGPNVLSNRTVYNEFTQEFRDGFTTMLNDILTDIKEYQVNKYTIYNTNFIKKMRDIIVNIEKQNIYDYTLKFIYENLSKKHNTIIEYYKNGYLRMMKSDKIDSDLKFRHLSFKNKILRKAAKTKLPTKAYMYLNNEMDSIYYTRFYKK
ncbi:hypothetical protein SGHV034 [Glossina pallidipes salivary gland hypertrophy virus]|uniref:Virion protein n=1 Tax=Glossina hytrovirus (isolate Glossina pallidipes/Ethiopia/Seibersdorf/-) TaxID=379529 RepID=B0YLI8_GHVS|nr:hypothetical protein SGHV034 [Glossina pallidipes salivary gland hypertrophy virus]ABQ08807.1 hypothetical protein SGHV034 [Glossina pallidipes salivary gland hypertrophy virus]